MTYHDGWAALVVLRRRVWRLKITAIGVLSRESANSTASQVDHCALVGVGRALLDVGVVQVQPGLAFRALPRRWVSHETSSVRCRSERAGADRRRRGAAVGRSGQ
jgi:hypothetical protein